MRRKRRTKLSVETNELLLIRPAAAMVQAWCPRCSQVVSMLPVDAAAGNSISARNLDAWVRAGTVHSAAADGRLLICLESLVQRTSASRD